MSESQKQPLQLSITFPTGPRFETLKDAIRHSVYGCGRQLKYIAADLEMTEAQLSRRLAYNPDDPYHFPAHLIDKLMEATGDLTPLYYLIDKFLKPKEEAARREFERIKGVLPDLERLIQLLKSEEDEKEEKKR